MQLNVIICCRIYLYAEGLWGLLKDDEELKVLGVACNDQDIQNLMQFEPDVVIADLFCCRKILKKYPSADDKKVLLINDSIDLSGVITSYSIHYTKLYDGRAGVPAAEVGLLNGYFPIYQRPRVKQDEPEQAVPS